MNVHKPRSNRVTRGTYICLGNIVANISVSFLDLCNLLSNQNNSITKPVELCLQK